MTLLGTKLEAGAAMAAPASLISRPLTKITSAGRRGELVTLPVLGRAWIELPGAVEWEAIQVATRRELAASELELTILTAELLELKLARYTLASAARNPDVRGEAFGTLEEWGALDPDVLNACWQVFGDVRERLDPLGHSNLSDEERARIEFAIKKKDEVLLRSFGVSKLSAYLATTVGLLSSSPSPSSSTSES